MSFSRATKIGAWADGNKAPKRENPLTQSSLEYEQFLQAKLYPRAGSTHSMPTNPRRNEKLFSKDWVLEPKSNPDFQSTLRRPAWASAPATRISEEEFKTNCSIKNGRTSYQDRDIGEPPLLQHSWRRHITPDRVSQAVNTKLPDFTHAPQSAAEIAALMRATQESIDMSRQREKIINGLLSESSRGEKERIALSGQQERNSLRTSEDSDGDISSLGRALNLSRAFRRMARMAKSQREARERCSRQLSQKQNTSVLRRYLHNWHETSKMNACLRALKQRKLRKAFSLWTSELSRHRYSNKQAERMYARNTYKKVMRILRGLMLDRKESNAMVARELYQEKLALSLRKKSLLQSAFDGLRKGARADAGQRRLEEESALRRMRIAALVSTLSAPVSQADAKTSSAVDELRKGSMGKRGNESKGIIVSPRNRASTGKVKASPTMSPRAVVLPLGSEKKHSIKKEPFALKRQNADADAKDLSPKWPMDAKDFGQGTGVNVIQQTAGSSRSLLEEETDDIEIIPPPAYSLTASTHVPHYLSYTAAAVGQKHGRAESKTSVRSTQSGNQVPSIAEAKLSQLELDARADERRKRLHELGQSARQRVRGVKEQEEERARKQKEQEDAEFSRSLEEHRREQLVTKAAMNEKAQEEAELKRKTKIATAHSTRSLLIRAGFGPWQRLMVQSRLNWAKSMNHRDDVLLQQTWIALYGYCMSSRSERARREYRQSSMAIAHFRTGLLRTMWRRWMLGRRLAKAKAVAITGHFSRYTVHRRAFSAWRLALERVRRLEAQQLKSVEPRGRKSALRYFWGKWLEYHQDALLDREINNRAQLTWQRVQGWLN